MFNGLVIRTKKIYFSQIFCDVSFSKCFYFSIRFYKFSATNFTLLQREQKKIVFSMVIMWICLWYVFKFQIMWQNVICNILYYEFYSILLKKLILWDEFVIVSVICFKYSDFRSNALDKIFFMNYYCYFRISVSQQRFMH